MGATVVIGALERFGFYPVGGGLLTAEIKPWSEKQPLTLTERSGDPEWRVNAYISDLPDHVGVRAIRVARDRFSIERSRALLRQVESPGPGIAVTVFAAMDSHTEVFTGFGARGKRAEKMAKEACDEAEAWDLAQVPVGSHLADQLLLPMALGAGGRFLTTEPTSHTITNIEVIRLFLPVETRVEKQDRGWLITVGER
jgi:RNA 3'-terminal phosphate cyclase (ATP)